MKISQHSFNRRLDEPLVVGEKGNIFAHARN